MNLVIDTNIVFSTLLNPHSIVGELLMNIQDQFIFFAPELLKEEIERYHSKILTYSKLNNQALFDLKELLYTNIHFVSETLISEQSWVKAYELIKDIDENDTPFVALAIELNVKLWTGDKVLTNGLLKKNSGLIVTTSDVSKLLE